MSNELTATMVQWLSHVRAASEAGMTLGVYAKQHGLSAAGLYKAKSDLMKRGAWPRTTVLRKVASRRKAISPASAFVSVQMEVAMPCRLRHASGWVIECDSLPSVAWLRLLMQESAHAAT
jgi:hypothetical protein